MVTSGYQSKKQKSKNGKLKIRNGKQWFYYHMSEKFGSLCSLPLIAYSHIHWI